MGICIWALCNQGGFLVFYRKFVGDLWEHGHHFLDVVFIQIDFNVVQVLSQIQVHRQVLQRKNCINKNGMIYLKLFK